VCFGEGFYGECFAVECSLDFVDGGKAAFSKFSDGSELFVESSLCDFLGKFFHPLIDAFFVSEINL